MEVERGSIPTASVHSAAMLLGQVTVIDRVRESSAGFLHVPAVANPLRPKRRQAIFHAAFELRITPRPAGVINANRFVYLDLALERLRGGEYYFAHRHADLLVEGAVHINARAAGHLVAAVRRGFGGARRVPGQASRLRCACGFEGIFGRDHTLVG